MVLGKLIEYAELGNKDPVVRLLVYKSNQTGGVIGKGGSCIRRLRADSGANIRMLEEDETPACGCAETDRVCEVSGDSQCVWKALDVISELIIENPPGEVKSRHPVPSQHGSDVEVVEGVAFHMLVPSDDVGAVIGLGGKVRVHRWQTRVSHFCPDMCLPPLANPRGCPAQPGTSLFVYAGHPKDTR